jgi:hypothetical protein
MRCVSHAQGCPWPAYEDANVAYQRRGEDYVKGVTALLRHQYQEALRVAWAQYRKDNPPPMKPGG